MTATAGAVHQHHHQRPLRGLLFLLCGVIIFACMDTATKYLAARYPAPLVVAVRYVVQCFLMIAVLAPTQGRTLIRTQRTGLVLLRASFLTVGSLLVAMALQRMPVAETSAIVFMTPLLVVLLAGPVLQERVGALGWVAALTGFGGLLLIARPGGNLDFTGVLFAIGGALVGAGYQLMSRSLATTETTLAMLFYTALTGALVYGVAAPWFWSGERPTLWLTLLFILTGAMGGVGHFFFTAAHRHLAASTLAPLQYVQLLWAGILGWLVFGHVPDGYAIAGMIIVAAAGGLVAVKSRLAARAVEQAAEA